MSVSHDIKNYLDKIDKMSADERYQEYLKRAIYFYYIKSGVKLHDPVAGLRKDFGQQFKEYKKSASWRYWITTAIAVTALIIPFALKFYDSVVIYGAYEAEESTSSEVEVRDNSIFPFEKIGGKIFYENKEVLGADSASFDIYTFMNCHNETYGSVPCYAYDKDSVYYYATKLQGASSKDFTFLDYGYMKDNDSVFYIFSNNMNWYLKDADPASFIVLGLSKSFSECNTSEGATTCLSESHYPYAKDKNYVYYDGRVLEEADSSTFRLIIGAHGYDAQDKTSYYKNGEIVYPNKKLP